MTKLIRSGHGAQVQDTILPAIFGTFYAMLVVLALLATVLLAVERPGWGGAFLLLLWVWLIIMMLAGPGAPCNREIRTLSPMPPLRNGCLLGFQRKRCWLQVF